MDDDWQVLEAKKSSFNLNKLFNPEFIKILEENFKDKNINLIQMNMVMMDKNINPNDDKKDVDSKIIGFSLSNKTMDDTINEVINVKSSDAEAFLKIKEILDNFKGCL